MELYPLAILTLLTMVLLVVLLGAMIHSHRQSSLDLQDIKTEIQLMYLQKLTAETEILLRYRKASDVAASLHNNVEKFCQNLLQHRKRWKNKPERIPAIHNAIDRAEHLIHQQPGYKKSLLVSAMVEESLREFRKSSVYANLLDHGKNHPSLYRNGLIMGVTDLLKSQYPELSPVVTIAGNDEERRYSPYLEMMLFDTCIMLIMSGAKEPGVNEITIFIDASVNRLELTFQTRRTMHIYSPQSRSAMALRTHNTVRNHIQLIKGEIEFVPKYKKGTKMLITLPVIEEPSLYVSTNK